MMATTESFLQRFLHCLGFIWNITKPAMWPETGRRLKHNLSYDNDIDQRAAAQHEEAVVWCQGKARSTAEAVDMMTNRTDVLKAVRLECLDILAEAECLLAGCPAKKRGAGNLDLLYSLCERVPVNAVLESGAAYGWSSMAVLLSLQNRSQRHLYSIDIPYLELHNGQWAGITVPESFCSPRTLCRTDGREEIPETMGSTKQFDLIHYDSDTYDGRLKTYAVVWDALRAGGILISDDIGDNLAFRDFCRNIEADPVIVEYEKKYQGILVKP